MVASLDETEQMTNLENINKLVETSVGGKKKKKTFI